MLISFVSVAFRYVSVSCLYLKDTIVTLIVVYLFQYS